MRGIFQFYASSIGKKFVMALTGLLLLGFLIGHLVGNLLIFAGPSALNEYARWLTERPALIWSARVGLLAIFLLHLGTAVLLVRSNKKARPVRYRVNDCLEASMASRSMWLSGLTVAAYLVYHLLHTTFGVIDPDAFHVHTKDGLHDVYTMLVKGFQDPLIVASYLLALVILGLHLSHGISSFFQSTGLKHPRSEKLIQNAGHLLTAVLIGGFLAIPLSVVFGIVKLPVGGN